METYKILIAEDDQSILESIEIYLQNKNYECRGVQSGNEALETLENEAFDLVIMDLMMPGLSGEETIEEIRKTSTVPILILSAKSEDLDKIRGLGLGADDYMTKPFNPMELLARVDAILRRNHAYNKKDQGHQILIGDILLLEDECRVEVAGRPVKLTPLEYQILDLLMSHPNKVFSMDEIYETIWKEPALDPKTVTVHIRRIREKIEINPKEPRYLQVAWGLGYKFVDPERR